jgi:hypothetical protein
MLKFATALVCSLFLLGAGSGQAQNIGSTNFSNLPSGNLGTSLSLFGGDVTITARTRIDPSQPYVLGAPGQVGTIFHEKSNDSWKGGLGVQDFGSGSKGISGGGPRANEELIFTYNQGGAIAGTISLLLNDIEFGSKAITNGVANLDKSDPVMWITLDFGQTLFVNEMTLFNAVVPNPDRGTTTVLGMSGQTISRDNSYLLDFSNIAGLDLNATVTSFTIRETNGHTFVKAFNAGVVPEPSAAALALAGSGFLFTLRRSRR